MNPAMLFKMKHAKEVFMRNHPKFPQFLEAVNKHAVKEGSVVEINVTTPEGRTLSSNIKLKESDIELLHELLKQD